MTLEETIKNFSELPWLIREKPDVPGGIEFVIKLPTGKYFGIVIPQNNLLEKLDIYCYNFVDDKYISYFLRKMNDGFSDGRRIREVIEDGQYLDRQIKKLRKRVRKLINETLASSTDSLS